MSSRNPHQLHSSDPNQHCENAAKFNTMLSDLGQPIWLLLLLLLLENKEQKHIDLVPKNRRCDFNFECNLDIYKHSYKI